MRYCTTTVSTVRTPVIPVPAWDSGVAMSYGERRLSRPDAPVVQLTNPFMDPLSRPGTADTAYSGMSYSSSSSSFGPRGDARLSQGQDRIFLSPFQLSPLTFRESEKSPGTPHSPGGESIYSLYDSPQDEYPDVDLEKATSVMKTPAHYLDARNATVRQTSWFPTRMHTATPHSVHSVSPSVEWTSEQQRAQTPLSRARTPSQRVAAPGPALNGPPPPIHARAASDPVYRPYTASPRMLHPDQVQMTTTYAPPVPDNTVLLPNPFPMVGATNVKRYASIGHTRAQLSYPGARSTAQNIRNAHLQAAMGRAPPRTLPVPVQTYPGRSVGRAPTVKKVVSRAEWRALVMNAASTR